MGQSPFPYRYQSPFPYRYERKKLNSDQGGADLRINSETVGFRRNHLTPPPWTQLPSFPRSQYQRQPSRISSAHSDLGRQMPEQAQRQTQWSLCYSRAWNIRNQKRNLLSPLLWVREAFGVFVSSQEGEENTNIRRMGSRRGKILPVSDWMHLLQDCRGVSFCLERRDRCLRLKAILIRSHLRHTL